MAKFTSPFASLILQDESGVWAKFEDGTFETSDAKVIARLRACDVDYITETPAPKPAAKRAPAKK